MEDELIRGDSAVIEFSLSDIDGKDVLLSDIDTLILTARAYNDGDVLFEKSKEDFKNEGNNYSVEILPKDTQELSLKEFIYDIDWYQDESFLANIVCRKKFIVLNKAGKVGTNGDTD